LCQQPINFCPIFFFANHREDQVGQIVLWLFLLSLYIYFLPELAKEKANVQKKVEKPYQIKKKRKRRKKREKKSRSACILLSPWLVISFNCLS